MKNTILIIEDNLVIALDISGILKNKGYEIFGIASSADEAMAIMEKERPNLILMDIILSGEKDGITLFEEIKKLYDIPVIYLTAHSDENTLQRAKKTEPYGYIIKPVNQQELLLTVEIALYKHKMEVKIRKSETDLRESQKVAMLGSYELDIGKGIWTSSGILDIIFGIDPQYDKSVTGWLSIVHPLDREMMKDYFRDMIARRSTFNKDYRIIRQNDGAERWVFGLGVLHLNEQGEPVAMKGTIQDITDRKLIEEEVNRKNIELKSAMEELGAANEELQSAMEELEATNEELMATNEEFEASNEELIRTQTDLANSEIQYHTLFTEMLDGYAIHEIICDKNGTPVDYRFIDFNPAFEKLTGIPRSAKGKRALEVLPGLEKYWIDFYGEVALKGVPKQFSNYAKDLGKWFDVTAYKQGENQFACIFCDITERKKAEMALQESEDKLRRTFNSIDDVITIMDIDYNIIWSNKAALERYGETGNKKCYEILKKRDQPCIRCITMETFSDGIPHKSEERGVLKNGATVFQMVSSSPVMGRDGKISSVVNVYKDITQRKIMEDRIKRLNILKEGLLSTGPLAGKLKKITGFVVEAFEAEFSRIWMIRPGDQCKTGCFHADAEGAHACRDKVMCLHLMSSSGRYTHTDGAMHRRIPFGCYKIGGIFSGGDTAFVTNDVANDQKIHDRDWAAGLGLTAFSGIKIMAETGMPIGVMALFSRHSITEEDNILLENIAGTAAQVIQTSEAEEKISASLKEKETLLREIHHRVKNNMQVITSLLTLQSSQIEDEEIITIFNECENRIMAMALIHEKLYHSDDMAHVNFKEYLTDFVQELHQSYAKSGCDISYGIHADDISLGIDKAIPCGLLANELISNVIKHAFPGMASGRFVVDLRKNSGENYILTVSDNGIGMPENIENIKSKSLGLQLVEALVKQIRGDLNISVGSGTKITITFPE